MSSDSGRAVALGELVEEQRERVSAEQAVQEKEWYVGLADIGSDGIGTCNPVPLDAEHGLKGTTVRFAAGDILYGRLRPYLNKVWLADRDGVCSPEIFVLRASDRETASYVSHFLRSPATVDALSALQVGTTMPRVSREAMFGLTLNRRSGTPLERALVALDETVAARLMTEQALNRLWTLLPATFDAMATGEPHRLPLGNFIESLEGGWSPRCLDRPVEENEPGVLKVSAVSGGRYRATENKALSPQLTPRSHLIVKRGDILFNRANSPELVGGTVAVTDDVPPLMFNDKVWRVVLASAQDRGYVLAALMHQRDQLALTASGTSPSMVNIAKKSVLQHTVPHLDEQARSTLDRLTTELTEIDRALSWRLNMTHRLHAALCFRVFGSEPTPPTAPAVQDAPADDRTIWSRLSARQNLVRRVTQTGPSPFTIRQLKDQLPYDSGSFTADEVRRTLDLLVVMGAVVREGREELEQWRVPDPDNDLVLSP